MKVLVSACLLGERCRFDGASKPSDAVIAFVAREDVEAVPVCPEVMGGMSVPHPPCEIVEQDGVRRVIDVEGVDQTIAFEAGAQAVCALAQQHACTHAILKAKSPSCGAGRIYDGTFSGALVSGDGITAAALRAAGISLTTEESFE